MEISHEKFEVRMHLRVTKLCRQKHVLHMRVGSQVYIEEDRRNNPKREI